jgi:hypothetical protein
MKAAANRSRDEIGHPRQPQRPGEVEHCAAQCKQEQNEADAVTSQARMEGGQQGEWDVKKTAGDGQRYEERLAFRDDVRNDSARKLHGEHDHRDAAE